MWHRPTGPAGQWLQGASVGMYAKDVAAEWPRYACTHLSLASRGLTMKSRTSKGTSRSPADILIVNSVDNAASAVLANEPQRLFDC